MFGGYGGQGMFMSLPNQKAEECKSLDWPAVAPGDRVTVIMDTGKGELAFKVEPRMDQPRVIFTGLPTDVDLCPVFSTNNKNAAITLVSTSSSVAS